MQKSVRRSAGIPAIRTWRAWLALLAPGLVCIGAFAYATLLLVREAHLLNYTEGILLHAVRQISDGAPLYRDIDQPPYTYFAYGPLYPLAGAAVTKVLGFGILPLRALTVACELLIGVLAYRMLRAQAAGRPVAAGGALLVLGILGLHKFHAIARVDMLVLTAVFFAYGALFLYLREGRRRHLVALALGLALAVLGKTSFVTAGGAVGVIAVVELFRDRRRGLALLAACAAAGLLYGTVALLLDAHTDGAFLRFQLHYQGSSGFCNPLVDDCKWELMLLKILLLRYGSLIALGLLSAIVTRGGGYTGILALVATAWVCVGSLKAGADLNYNIELLVLLCMLVVLALPRWLALASRLAPRFSHRAQSALLPMLMLACLASPLITGLPVHDWDRKSVQQPTREDMAASIRYMGGAPAQVDLDAPFDLLAPAYRAEREKIAALTRQATGIVLAEEPFFAVLAGKTVWMSDPFQLGVLHARGIFDISPILEACRDGRIQWVFAGYRLLAIEELKRVLDTHFIQVYETKTPIASSYWTVYRRR